MFTENFEVSNMLSYMWNFGTEGWSGSTWYKMGSSEGSALAFRVLAKCSTSRARVAEMTLPHSVVDTPVFMPVGTQGTLKGLLPEQLVAMDCRIMLSNTYHLGNRLFSEEETQLIPCMKSSPFNTKTLGRVLKSWKQLGVFTSIQKQNHSNPIFSLAYHQFALKCLMQRFMGWPRSLLTDSGGFQMVSLLEVLSSYIPLYL